MRRLDGLEAAEKELCRRAMIFPEPASLVWSGC
jgi:hypothetical protein